MRSEILSSNFDLLNLGAARRSIFGGSGTSSSSSSSRNTERNIDNSITSNSQNRRQTKRSQSQESPAEQQGKPSLKTLSRKRPLGQRFREPMASTAASSSSFFSRPSHQRAASSRTRSAAAAAAAATIESPLDLGLDEAGGSVASSAGVKRKRPSLPRTRGSSGVSSRAVSYRTAKEPASVSAPLSHDSTSSLRSISGSEDSSGSHISRRTSKSSLSLRRELRALAIESHSATSSPTRPRQARGTSSGRDASLSPETLADTTVVDRRRLSRQPSSSKPPNDEHAEYGEDVSSDAEDEESRANEDYLLLTLAPATQLERLRKDRLVALARQAGVPSDGLTRAQLIETLIGQRDPRRRYESSRAASGSFKNRRQASGMSKRSVSSQSADYTDESDESQGDEAGHEGGGEETEAEGLAGTAASRKRKPLRQPRLEDVFAGLSSSAKSAGGGRKIKGVRPSRVISPQRATGNYRTDEDPQTSATPLVNRLRNAKSMQFAASSPARARTRMRGPMAGVKRAAPALPDPSPVKNKLRKMKSSKSLALGRSLKAPSPPDEKMDEDWVDSVPAVPPRRKTKQRRAKTVARQNLQVDSDDEDMTGGHESREEAHDDDDSAGDDGEQAFPTSSQTDGEAINGDDERDDGDEDDEQGEATEREEDQQDESDITDVPDDEEVADDYGPSAPSPSKMRRLRNGKVRIKGTVQVHDASEALGSSVQPLKPVSPPKKAQAGGGKVKAVKTKPPTPPLSDRNAGAVSAGPENVDELNGLDLESLNLTDKEIPARQLEKLSRIGSGGFKDVFVGIWKVGKRRNKVAIADIREKLTEMDIKELGLLRDLKHENIVRFIGVSIPEDTAKTGIPCMIVSELCSNGDLWDYVRNVKPPPDLQIFRMLLETAKGLEYLHMHSIVHRDVKSSNVLVTRERSCKINDFGLARVKTSQRSKMKSVVGTINWQAVELWCRQPQYNEKVDVWSAAMTFWETLQWYEDYKSYPFEGMNDFVIYEEVGKEGKRPPTDKIAAQFGEEIVKLLNRMWDTDPRKRPTMDMVCKDLERLIEVKEMEMDQ